MKNLLKKYKNYLYAPIITTLIILLVFLFKGIYPFGKMTIANGDMGQSYITFYHFLYDVFHGTKSVFYDYNLGMGSNTFGGFIVDGLLSPTSWVVLLNSRENVSYMISFVLIFKLAFISITSHILFEKINKKNPFYNYIFSVLYALSSYNLMYNTNIMWLDIVGLFPLFILATKRMFDTNRVTWFSIILALMLIFNYNLSFMILMFIIFIIPIYIHYEIEKDKRKTAVFNLFVGVLFSIGLSAFAFIPSLIQVMTSYRMSGETSVVTDNINFFYKLGTFFFYPMPILLYYYWLKTSKEKNNYKKISFLSVLLTAIIPIFFERVNLWWHAGSYQSFPYRYGFIPLLIIYMGALRYCNEIKIKEKKENYIPKILLLITIFIASTYFCQKVIKIINYNNPALVFTDIHFLYIFIIFVLTMIMSIIIIKINKKKLRYLSLSILTLLLTFTYTYSYIGVKPDKRVSIEWSDEGIFYAYKVQKAVKENKYRLKDISNTMYENSPVVSNIPSMSTFLHIISKEQVLNAIQLGYSTNNTKLNDLGGSLFTDALYNIKYVISPNKLPEELYTYKGKIEDNYLYEYKYLLPYGLTYQQEITNIPENLKLFEAQNYLYQKLFDKDDNIFESEEIEWNFENTIEKTINVQGEKELYLFAEYKKVLIDKITVNDKPIGIDKIKNNIEGYYPYTNIKGFLDLGYYKDEEVKIIIETKNNNAIKNPCKLLLGELDISKYKDLANNSNHNINVKIEKNTITIDGTSEKDQKYFVPITYDEGFKGNVPINRVLNTFIGVNLKEGENHIKMTFTPKAFNKSLLLTIGTIVMMFILTLIRKVFDIRNIKIIMTAFWLLGLLIYSALIIKFYIISIIQTFLDLFH